jgi:uncharacterized protein (DUF1800 family)
MTLSRRQFLGSSAALAAVAAATATTAAVIPEPRSAEAACAMLPVASAENVAMHRLSYGPSPAAVAEFRALGSTDSERYERWVAQQLNWQSIDDSACEQILANTRLKIRYDAVNEVRPLTYVLTPGTHQQINRALWINLVRLRADMHFAERRRPTDEVKVATWIRALYSRRQLFEVLTDFWHNHFNVNPNVDDRVLITWPAYDRLIRTHALGNFRNFLVDVAQSVAMMYYLNNVSNRAAGGEGGNENFARELFELHTLGSDNYLKFYDRRNDIGTITLGDEIHAGGYIDDDVYNASYAFTGWSIADGSHGANDPNDGSFYYDNSWHQPGPKLILLRNPTDYIGVINTPRGEAEGYEVIDRVAYHPGTARHIVGKLCRRLVSDTPSDELITAATDVWLANRRAPNQIELVLRTILLSDECRRSFGGKVKRPLEAIWAYLRATGAVLPSDQLEVNGNTSQGGFWQSLFWTADTTGHRLFGWEPPTGHPDTAAYWANTNGLLTRWSLPYSLTQSWGGNVQIDVFGQTPMNESCVAVVDYWLNRLCGYSVAPGVRQALITFLAQGMDPNQPPQLKSRIDERGRIVNLAPDWGDPAALQDRVRALVQLIATTPEFNLR